MAKSVVAGLRQGSLTIGDVSQRNYFTPIYDENVSAVYTHDDSDTSASSIVSSYRFALSIMSYLMPYIGINKSLSPKITENDTDPADVSSELQVSYHN